MSVGIRVWVRTQAEVEAFKRAGAQEVGQSVTLAALAAVGPGPG